MYVNNDVSSKANQKKVKQQDRSDTDNIISFKVSDGSSRPAVWIPKKYDRCFKDSLVFPPTKTTTRFIYLFISLACNGGVTTDKNGARLDHSRPLFDWELLGFFFLAMLWGLLGVYSKLVHRSQNSESDNDDAKTCD